MVEMIGIGPTTSCMRSKRSPIELHPQRATIVAKNGGDNRNRTGDLLLAKQALSQLSYTPGNGGPGRI